MLSPLYDLVERPNHFQSIARGRFSGVEYHIDRVIFSRFRDIAVWSLAPPPLLPPLTHLPLHIRPKSVGQTFTLGSEVISYVSEDSLRDYYSENNFNTLVVATERENFEFVSSGVEVEGHNVSFLRFLRESDWRLRHSAQASSAPSARRRIRARVLLLELMSWCEEVVAEESWNRRCRLLRCPYRWVTWRRIDVYQ